MAMQQSTHIIQTYLCGQESSYLANGLHPSQKRDLPMCRAVSQIVCSHMQSSLGFLSSIISRFRAPHPCLTGIPQSKTFSLSHIARLSRSSLHPFPYLLCLHSSFFLRSLTLSQSIGKSLHFLSVTALKSCLSLFQLRDREYLCFCTQNLVP